MSRATIGAMLIVRDEERHLVECLDALDWCDEIAITVDALSTDATADIAHRYTDNVISHELISLPNQRTLTLDRLHTDWVWVMDADERMTPELRSEIERTVANPDGKVAFWVPRKNLVLGKWIRHAGWYPDYQLRLWKRGKVQYDQSFQSHERMRIDGDEGQLEQPYIHHNYERIGQLFSKQRFYAELEARTLRDFGLRARPQNFLLQPLREFKRRYFDLQGYKDGGRGLVLCVVMAWFNVQVYFRLARLAGIDWTFGRRSPRSASDASGGD